MTNEKAHDARKRGGSGQSGVDQPPEENLIDVAQPGGPTQGDMNVDPLAGAIGQDSLQDDMLEDATEEDTGLPARDEAAPDAGPASKNTSTPTGREIGETDPPRRNRTRE